MDDPVQWKYTRGIAGDGNFVARHQHQPRTQHDVWIKDGQGFMTRRAPYHDHLKNTKEVPEVSVKLVMSFCG